MTIESTIPKRAHIYYITTTEDIKQLQGIYYHYFFHHLLDTSAE